MTVVRTCMLLLSLAGVALAVVYVRTEQNRCAARTLRLEAKWVDLRRQWWNVQTGVARLRAPQRVKECVDYFETDLVPPGFRDQPRRPTRLAANHR